MVEITADDTIRRVSLVDNVTVGLRNALLNGEIRPGDRIRVPELEKRFGVSHIPIREALRRLEAEGLVVTNPQRAAVAAGVDLEDLTALYDLRRMVECDVIHRSVAAMTDEEVGTVRAALAALREVESRVDSDEFWQRHREFHWALLEPGATAWVKRVVDQTGIASERYVRIFVGETAADAMRDHCELLEACESRDAERAADVLLRHLDLAEQVVRRHFPSTQEES